MAMGIVSDKEFGKEFTKLNESPSKPKDKVLEGIVEDSPDKGRGKGNIKVPQSLRNIIGQTAVEYGRQESVELAKNFGISPSSTSAYANGSNSTSSYNERPNAGVIRRSKEKISMRARAKLMLALTHITEDKLREAKPRDLAGIAKDMSAVSKNMEDTDSNKIPVGTTGPTFVFYSPKFFNEDNVDVVRPKE
jgi:hypothetical protein